VAWRCTPSDRRRLTTDRPARPEVRDRSASVRLAAVVCVLILAGCAPQLDRIEEGVQRNQDAIDELRATNERLQQDTAVLADLLRLERASGDENSVQRLTQLSQLSRRIDQLMQMLDDNASYMRDLSARVDLLAIRGGIATLGDFKPPPGDGGVGTDALPEEGRSIFTAAQLDRSRGNVELAREGFTEFLEKYPQSELAPDAWYWLGSIAYGEQDYETALTNFTTVREQFPESQWIPAALLKSINCLQRLDRSEEAALAREDLLTKHADSNEAALVREQLEGR